MRIRVASVFVMLAAYSCRALEVAEFAVAVNGIVGPLYTSGSSI